MTPVANRPPRSRSIQALWLLSLVLALAWLAGCAAQGPRVSSTPTPGVEPITASDEPPAVRRARLRYELAANYFDQGQTTVALDEIMSLSARILVMFDGTLVGAVDVTADERTLGLLMAGIKAAA